MQDILYSNIATVYGTEMEAVARQEYAIHQRQTGHPSLAVDNCGLCISVQTPWLAASSDGMVCDQAT